jgi:hypothetical protein
MTTIQKQANSDVNVAEMEETDDLEHPETWISAEEWFHELGGMLANHFGDDMRNSINDLFIEHGMKPLP